MHFAAGFRTALAGLAVAVAVAGTTVTATAADSVADFYKSHDMTMIIGSSVGGGYNQYGRMVARHIGRHIPGHPDVISKNMVGASGRKALNYVYNVAPADGTTVGIISRNTLFDPLLNGDKSIDVDTTKLDWLGSANSEVSLCVSWHTSGIKTLADVRTRGMAIGSSGPTSTDRLMANVLNRIAATKIKVITGYPGSTEEHLAMERGELDGRCGLGWDSIVSRYSNWLRDHSINILVQMATKKSPELPDVPSVLDFAKNETERQMLRVFTVPNEMGRPFFMRPGIPEARVKALQTAFMETMKDPKFLAEAKTQHLAIDPRPGNQVAKLVREVYATPPAAMKLVHEILNSKEGVFKRQPHYYTVEARLISVEGKGKRFVIMDKGKKSQVFITGGHHGSKVTVSGKPAKRTALEVGMTCTVTYEGDHSVAKAVACK